MQSATTGKVGNGTSVVGTGVVVGIAVWVAVGVGISVAVALGVGVGSGVSCAATANPDFINGRSPKYIKTSAKKRHRVERIYQRWGAPSLFFSFLPIIGDPLCIIPGIFELDLKIFTYWVVLGKLFRYLVLF